MRPRVAAKHIQALTRADAILESIANSGSGCARLRDIARETGLNKTTAFNLVRTLVALGYVAHEKDSRVYRLGLRNLQLGRCLQRQHDIVKTGRPFLMQICKATGETVNLALPYLFDAMIVDSLEGTFGIRATSYAGTRAPYHSTACGKAILAHLDPSLRDEIYAHPMPPVTPHTITDAGVLDRQLIEVRRLGYALDIEENELGAHCVAVPIFDRFADIVGSISVAGPSNRMTVESLPRLAEIAKQEAKRISDRLFSPAPEGPVAVRRRAVAATRR